MGEFNTAVLTLIETFGRGISVIRRLRRRRREANTQIDLSVKAEEVRLSRSLKRSKKDVEAAYARDLNKLGSLFAVGDEQAHSSLTSILARLSAGFASIVQRFMRGRSTRTDYLTLVNLSNVSRIEAVDAICRLSSRLSQSSVAISEENDHSHAIHGRGKKRGVHGLQGRGLETNSNPQRPRTKPGWPFMSGKGLPGSARKKPSKTASHHRKSESSNSLKKRKSEVLRRSASSSPITARAPSTQHAKHRHRRSSVSFNSDSTKIGEIPDHKLARPVAFISGDRDSNYPTAYPLYPWKEPDKPKSRFLRFFRR